MSVILFLLTLSTIFLYLLYKKVLLLILKNKIQEKRLSYRTILKANMISYEEFEILDKELLLLLNNTTQINFFNLFRNIYITNIYNQKREDNRYLGVYKTDNSVFIHERKMIYHIYFDTYLTNSPIIGIFFIISLLLYILIIKKIGKEKAEEVYKEKLYKNTSDDFVFC